MAKYLYFAATETEFLNDDGDTLENHGWVNPTWSNMLYDEREEVDFAEVPSDEDMFSFMETFFGTFDRTPSSTGVYYYDDPYKDINTGKVYSYSVIVEDDDDLA